MLENGYIKVWRKLSKSFFYKDSEYVHLWVHLLMSAYYEPVEFSWNGQRQTAQRGQLLTGTHQLSEQTGIERSKVVRILKVLKSEQQIEQQTNNRFSLITILNYEEYQGNNEQQNEQQVNNKRTTDEHIKRSKEGKEGKEVSQSQQIARSAPKPVKTRELEPDHELQGTIDHICKTYETKRIAKYPFNGKHAKFIKGVSKIYGHAATKALWDCYLDSNDEFFARTGYSIEAFCTSLPKLLDGPWRSVKQKYETKSSGFATPEQVLTAVAKNVKP